MRAAAEHEPVRPDDQSEWYVRQRVPGGRACVWVVAPDATAAAVIADHLVGPMGGWAVGPNVESEVFPHSDYAKHADPGDFTRMVIDRPVRGPWLAKRLQTPSNRSRTRPHVPFA